MIAAAPSRDRSAGSRRPILRTCFPATDPRADVRLHAGKLWLSPSDLATHLACHHATALTVDAALAGRRTPYVNSAYGDLIREKGLAHERAYLEHLGGQGRDVVEVAVRNGDYERAAIETAEAMRAGADVVYQGVFVADGWRGVADFVERVPGATALGSWGYEAVDTKLARVEMKPHHVLQLGFYSHGIERVQGVSPTLMHLVLGSGERESLRVREFAAYRRHAAGRLADAVATRAPTQPYPNDHCPLCDFRSLCDADWRRADHLSYVANIRRDQVERLRNGGVETLTALAGLPPEAVIPDLHRESVAGLRDQARLQRQTLERGALAWERRAVAERRGFARLPPPSPGDVMFDVEADPYWTAAQPLTFLFGLLLRDGDDWVYEPVWAHDAAGEQAAFERVADLVHERLADDPGMHVYHYSPADPTDLKRLMGRYATREDAIDELLRRQVFVDLLAVVRQGAIVGAESYGLKTVETLSGFRRAAQDVGSGADAVVEYERWRGDGAEGRLARIARYNEDDCRATLAVRHWLLATRPPDASWLEPVPPRAGGEPAEASDERERLRHRLGDGQPEDSARWLAGELLLYHKREQKPAWWQYFARLTMDDDELVADAEAIGGLEPSGPAEVVKRSYVYPLRFPVQRHKIVAGDDVIDPVTRRGVEVVRVDEDEGIVRIKRGQKRAREPLPSALVPGEPIPTHPQRAALGRLARDLDAGGSRYRALHELLARVPPRFAGRAPGPFQTTALTAQRALALALDESALVIQGPPGTGKTYTGARLVTALLRAGRRVGVTALSHKAIDNLLREIERAADDEGLTFRGARKSGPPGSGVPGARCIEHLDHDQLETGDHQLVAGTTWLFARPAWDGQLDVLVIDEAGQLSLADALAAGTSARSLVLLGDPQQLAHVSQGTHPGGTGASVLQHALAGDVTVREDRGLLLEETWRMHPAVCRFISEEIYDGRLRWRPACGRQATSSGTGIRYVPVEHRGNSSSSREEAQAVARTIGELLAGGTWTTAEGEVRLLRPEDVMVVTPYNAQVRVLRHALPAGVPVGTVDRFQGQEAPVVLFSMATSSGDDLPREIGFTFSRNRLNVALSRARCLAYVVCCPALLSARARTVDQLRLISTLCAAVEEAGRQH